LYPLEMPALSKNDLIAHLSDTFAPELAEVEIEEYFRMNTIKVMGVLKPGVEDTVDLRKRMEQDLDAHTMPQIRVEVVLLSR
jgi:hypothetical protein